MARFKGHCEKICGDIDVTPLSRWLALIPFEDWPQQQKLFGELRPAAIIDPGWHGFGILAAAFVGRLNHPGLAGKLWVNPMLSVVMPNHFIPSHKDKQPLDWAYRIHFPLTTNKDCLLIMNKSYHLEVGKAYKVNIEREHAIINNGSVPRIHFMIDVNEPGDVNV